MPIQCSELPLFNSDGSRFSGVTNLVSISTSLRKPPLPLDQSERKCLVVAIESAFMRLANLRERIVPIYDDYELDAPSASVMSRDLSEKIERSITQHCRTFTPGLGHADLARSDERWEVKICKHRGLSINQSASVGGENYIVVNYEDSYEVRRIFVLWEAEDGFFSERKSNANIRSMIWDRAAANIEILAG